MSVSRPGQSLEQTIHRPTRDRLRDLVAIARPDHWFKNVFVLPGVVVAWTMDPDASSERLPFRLLLALAAACLVASSNYVINEVLDAPFDRYHPSKQHRPMAAGRVNLTAALATWLVLMALGIALGFAVSREVGLTLAILWIMGCAYNIPPIRTKDAPYVDVLSEAINNPLRLLVGWYCVSQAFPPASLLFGYWMIGCYFMASKRFAEQREFVDTPGAVSYRRSFAYYTPDRLLVSIMFYGSAAMLFFGAFIMRYDFDLILSFPLMALVMATYLRLALSPHSAVQAPERLYREPLLMVSVAVCTLVMLVLLVIDVPALEAIFAPTVRPSWWWRPGLAP